MALVGEFSGRKTDKVSDQREVRKIDVWWCSDQTRWLTSRSVDEISFMQEVLPKRVCAAVVYMKLVLSCMYSLIQHMECRKILSC